jgi:hypothetical protein
MIIEQIAQAAGAASSGNVRLLDVGVIALVIKAAAEIGTSAFRAYRERSKERQESARVAIEQAKALGISLSRPRNGEPKPQPLIAVACPSHQDLDRRLTTNENEVKHINEDLREIKSDVKTILREIKK